MRISGVKVPKNYKIQVENIVASAKLDAGLNLDTIAFNLENSEYEPEQFPGLVYKLKIQAKEPFNATFLLFSNGKVVCTGTKSEDNVHLALDQLIESLKKIKQ